MQLAIKKLAWQGLTVQQKTIFKMIFEKVELGFPAIYLDESLNEWYTFSDGRLKLIGLAALGCMAANIADWPTGYTVPGTWAELRSDVKTWLRNPARTHPLVYPSEITYPEDADVYQYTLDQQGAPAAIRGSISGSWAVSGSVE